MNKTKKPKTPSRTFVILVNDHSGSIGQHGLTAAMKNSDTAQVNTLKSRAEEEGLTILLGRVDFADRAEVTLHPTFIDQTVVPGDYYSYGNTALLDAVGKAIEVLQATNDTNKDTAFLVIVTTDGEENYSVHYNPSRLADKIKEVEKDGRWTIAFNVPRGYKDALVRKYNIPADCVREWEQTVQGVQETEEKTSKGINCYLAARSAGHTKVTNFYDVKTDLSNLAAKTVHSELNDLSGKLHAYTVDKEAPIKEFVEKSTGKPYVIGSAYYCLTKSEKIQPEKQILLSKRGEKSIWGGKEARELIGLPTDGVSHSKVEPINHAGWDIFVESRSVNRKLVRGTRIMVDKSCAKNKSPAWGTVTAP